MTATNPKAARTVSRRKLRRAHFQAPSHIRRRLMSSALSKDLKARYNVNALPVRKDDEVRILRGPKSIKGKEGKVTACYRLKWVIHVDKAVREKCNGSQVNIGIHPSNVEITKLKLTKNREAIISRKAANGNVKSGSAKAKTETAATAKAMKNVD